MIIELQRAFTPEDMQEAACGACGRVVAPASVLAKLRTEDRYGMDFTCPDCIEYLGSRNPEKSPTIEVYREMLERYPEPMYPNEDEFGAAAEATGFADPALEAPHGPQDRRRLGRSSEDFCRPSPTAQRRIT